MPRITPERAQILRECSASAHLRNALLGFSDNELDDAFHDYALGTYRKRGLSIILAVVTLASSLSNAFSYIDTGMCGLVLVASLLGYGRMSSTFAKIVCHYLVPLASSMFLGFTIVVKRYDDSDEEYYSKKDLFQLVSVYCLGPQALVSCLAPYWPFIALYEISFPIIFCTSPRYHNDWFIFIASGEWFAIATMPSRLTCSVLVQALYSCLLSLFTRL